MTRCHDDVMGGSRQQPVEAGVLRRVVTNGANVRSLAPLARERVE